MFVTWSKVSDGSDQSWISGKRRGKQYLQIAGVSQKFQDNARSPR